eukprot:767354-Hanusia_phi.AAC.1
MLPGRGAPALPPAGRAEPMRCMVGPTGATEPGRGDVRRERRDVRREREGGIDWCGEEREEIVTGLAGTHVRSLGGWERKQRQPQRRQQAESSSTSAGGKSGQTSLSFVNLAAISS